MPNYLDNIDIIDANEQTVNVLLQDRETLALANQNASNIAQEITDRTNADTALQATIDDVIEDVYYLNVKDYGAVGDGVTDDTDAIQSAINAAVGNAVNKSVIVFPNGTYVINGSIEIYSSNFIRIMGMYRRSVITRTNSSSDPLFKVGDGSNTVGGFELHHLTFKNVNNHAFCFLIRSTQVAYIHRCRIENIDNFVRFGSEASDVANGGGLIELIEGYMRADDNTVFCSILANSNGIELSHNSINAERGHYTVFCECTPLTAYDSLIVKDNFIQRMEYGVIIGDNRATNTLQNFFIYNNIFDGMGGNCILIRKRNSGGSITRAFMNDNWFSVYHTIANDCVVIDRTAEAGFVGQITLNDNSFILCPLRAISIANSYAVSVENNKINGFNALLDGHDQATYSAITAIGDESLSINNNHFEPTSDLPSANNKYGIYLSDCSNVTLNNNTLQGVTTPLTGTPTVAVGNLPVGLNN